MVDSPLQSESWEQPEDVKAHYERSKDALIMMVDDEPILMGVVQSFLEEWGYTRFVTCEDSRKAVGLITSERPDVLLLDLVMPEVTGFDILLALSRNEETMHLPVIVLTSSTDSETKLKALEMGATDFLAKPVDSSELALRLRNTLTVKAYQDRLANFDQLTGLPNRKTFLERLEWAMRRKHLESEERHVLLVGLDRFKLINDNLGPDVGDQILMQMSARLMDVVSAIGNEDIAFARLGSDEFALLSSTTTASSVEALADAILTEIREPFYIDEVEVFVTASIGICSTEEVKRPNELFQKASVAEKFAKQHGRDSYQIYSKEIDAEAEELYRLERDLRRALENDELELFYQPKVDALGFQIVGMEALLRWRHKDGELISPMRFIPIAEESGLIISIGEWILAKACEQNKRLEEAGLDYKVSVNVSGQQVTDSNFLNSVKTALKDSQLAPEKLIVEITETTMMSDNQKSLEVFEAIRDLGATISVDDFGTGYSSLSYLKRFPIAELKIDQSFVRDLTENSEDAAIVRAILAMAHALDLSVTAEGVETLAQAKYLAEHNCEILQGYYFSKPKPFEEYKEFCLGYVPDA